MGGTREAGGPVLFGVRSEQKTFPSFLGWSCCFYSLLALILPSGVTDTDLSRKSQPCITSVSPSPSLLPVCHLVILAPLPLDQFRGSVSVFPVTLGKKNSIHHLDH